MIASAALAIALAQSATDYREDLKILADAVEGYAAYAKADGVDVRQLAETYRPRFAKIPDRDALLRELEAFVGELRDFHATLNTNNLASPRLVPSGTDLVAYWKGRRAFVFDVKAGSVARMAGIRPRDEIIKVGDLPVREAAAAWFGVRKPDARGWEWALNSAVACRWNGTRKFVISRSGEEKRFDIATAQMARSKARLTIEQRAGGMMYLRPEDSLGDNRLVADFDAALPAMRRAKTIVIDLRNTPGGGNSTVARGILGEFLKVRRPYQHHIVEERDTRTVRDWVEYGNPRTPKPPRGQVFVLVGKWTGSMGEGLAIGFDATGSGTVVGTAMAGLRGAVDGILLPKSGISVYFPTEQLFHINGTPRHQWVPRVRVVPGPGDPWLEAVKRLAVVGR